MNGIDVYNDKINRKIEALIEKVPEYVWLKDFVSYLTSSLSENSVYAYARMVTTFVQWTERADVSDIRLDLLKTEFLENVPALVGSRSVEWLDGMTTRTPRPVRAGRAGVPLVGVPECVSVGGYARGRTVTWSSPRHLLANGLHQPDILGPGQLMAILYNR